MTGDAARITDAALYDAFLAAAGKDHGAEAVTVSEAIRRRNPAARTLLDVGCGTGGHLRHLATDFDCYGVDLDAGRLAVARDLVPHAGTAVADMRKLPFGPCFDAVTCLFTSIGHADSALELRRTIRAMAGCLAPGGVLVVEPWFQPDRWQPGHVDTRTTVVSGRPAVQMTHAGRRGDLAILDTHHLIGGPAGIEHRNQRLRLRLHTWVEYETACTAEGLSHVEVDRIGPTGRGLIVASRAPASDRP